MTEPPDQVAPVSRDGAGRPRPQLNAIDQLIFGAGMLIAMVAVVVGLVAVVDSRGRMPYVLIGGVALGAASLAYLRRRSRATRVAIGLPPTPPHATQVDEPAPDTLDQ